MANQPQDPQTVRKISRRLKVALGISTIMLGALAALFALGSYFFFIPFSKHTSQLDHSLQTLQTLSDLKLEATVSSDSTRQGEIAERITALQAEILRVESYREKLMQETATRAENIIRMSTFFVTSVSFFFGIFTLVIGWLSYRRYDELKRELEDRIKERYEIKEEVENQNVLIDQQRKMVNKSLKESEQAAEVQQKKLEEIRDQINVQRTNIDQQKQNMDDWQKTFTSEVEAQQSKLNEASWESEKLIVEQTRKVTERLQEIERRMNDKSSKLSGDIQEFNQQMDANNRLTVENRQYIRTIADEFYGSTIIEILSALHESEVITVESYEGLKTLMAEAQYLISLNDPDPQERQKAIYGLYGLGTGKALSKLKMVMENQEETAELRMLAQRAILEIEKRDG